MFYVLLYVYLLYVHFSFAIILMGKIELVALLSLSGWCLVIVVWLFLAVPWVCLQFVIVVIPDHAHLLFFKRLFQNISDQKLKKKHKLSMGYLVLR